MTDFPANHGLTHPRWPQWLPYLVTGLILLALLPLLSNYLKYVVTKILIYTVFAMSLNLLYGYSGLFSLGHAIFFGVGGYAAGILMIHYQVMSFWWIFPASILAAGAVAALYGLIALKTKGLFFLFTTLVLSQLTENVATKWRDMTGGSNGLVGIPHPALGFVKGTDPAITLYIVVTCVFLLSLFALNRLLHSPFGESLQGIRDDEDRMAQLGYNTWLHKYIIFIISGLFAGAAGGLFGSLNGIMVPAHAGVTTSTMAMLMVIMGGTGTVLGPVLGAVAVTALELAASIYIPERWPMILGSVFVLTVLFLRGGIVVQLARLVHWIKKSGELAMEALVIKGLSKNFGAVEVLKEISLSVAQGEHVAVIGPNGAGKSTLLNCISGDLKPDGGQVCLLDRDVTRLPPYRRVHQGMARSYQLTRIFPTRTVLQNTLLALQGKRPSRFQMARSAISYPDLLAKAKQLLTLLGLWEKRDQLASQVSYGDRRKMEIALSLALEPRVLLLDEPSAGLDLGEIHDFIVLIRNLSKDITVLFAAHDMDVVFGLADRVVVLYYGKFIADGTPEAIKTDPKVRAIYLGMM